MIGDRYSQALVEITVRHAQREKELLSQISLLERDLRRAHGEIAILLRDKPVVMGEGCYNRGPQRGGPINFPSLGRAGRARVTTSNRPDAGP